MKSRTGVEPMRELEPWRVLPTLAFEAPTPKPREASNTQVYVASTRKTRNRTIWQFMQFGLVGCVNTSIDLLVLNGLLWLWPAQSIARLLLFNTLAFTFGALNSFVFNRYWTFQREGPPNAREGARFLLVTLAAIACNDLILWFMRNILHPAYLNPTLWTNVSKVAAIGGTLLVSYLGMRLWVFVQSSHEKQHVRRAFFQHGKKSSLPESTPISWSQHTTLGASFTTHGLSVVLPAYNEEQVIASTVEQVTHELANLTTDFEVIVVNDGSTDRTGAVLSALQKLDRRIRVLTHTRNQGYGATLTDGFAAATKELTFLMDSDGQFDIRELKRFLSHARKFLDYAAVEAKHDMDYLEAAGSPIDPQVKKATDENYERVKDQFLDNSNRARRRTWDELTEFLKLQGKIDQQWEQKIDEEFNQRYPNTHGQPRKAWAEKMSKE